VRRTPYDGNDSGLFPEPEILKLQPPERKKHKNKFFFPVDLWFFFQVISMCGECVCIIASNLCNILRSKRELHEHVQHAEKQA
jgi:hypothetical protein